MLTAVSIILPSTSRRLLSTSLATNGNAANTSGTIVGTVPTTVCAKNLVTGKTIIIRIRNGMDLSKFMTALSTDSIGFGNGSIPSFSPTTSNTPSGRPTTSARNVEIIVTYTVSHIANGISFCNISSASFVDSGLNIRLTSYIIVFYGFFITSVFRAANSNSYTMSCTEIFNSFIYNLWIIWDL